MTDDTMAERLGLSVYDLVMLAAEECGLIPDDYQQEVEESCCTICRKPGEYPECESCWYGEERRWTG
jgi:hypothetical protein